MKKLLFLSALLVSALTAYGQTDVEFCVDLSCATGTDAAGVAGSFNGFNSGLNPLTDDDGDGVFCAVIALDPGEYEYLFFTAQDQNESFTEGDPCTVTNFGFTNRALTVGTDPINLIFGFESCDASCPPPAPMTDVTFCVDLSCFPVVNAPAIQGSFNGFNPGANPLDDLDGDGIFCTTIALEEGDYEFIYFTAEEQSENLNPDEDGDCTVTNSGFTNRIITVGPDPITVTNGFETCAAECEAPAVTTPVTFCVDLSCAIGRDAASVFGSFNGFNPGANMVTDEDGDGVFCTTIDIEPGDYEYLFFTAQDQGETFAEGAPCTVTNFGFTNRTLTVGLEPIELMFGFESCDETCPPPPPMTDVTFCVDLTCFDQVDAVAIQGSFNGFNPGANFLEDADGDGVYCTTIPLVEGDYEYVYFFAQEQSENMDPTEDAACTVTNFGFTNRIITVGPDPITETSLWESCASETSVTTIDQTVEITDDQPTVTLTAEDVIGDIVVCGLASEATVEFDRSLTFTGDDIGVVTVTAIVTSSTGGIIEETFTVTVGFEQPNLACVTEVNLTLDDQCEGLLIPQMLLRGNTTLLGSFEFEITVLDDNPDNGPVVDGCGRFQYSITSIGEGPLDLDFTKCWGYVNAEDKTPPATVFTPDDVELLCVDVDGNTLTTLPNTISKCYRVNSADGSTVTGSMSTVLNQRLRAGGSSPLVPTFTDGCTDEIEVCVSDVLVYDAQDPACNDVVLTRTFTATEISVCPSAAGEENPSVIASYQIIFSRPTLDDLNEDNVQDVVEYEQCGVANPTRADYPAPRAGDFPFLEVAGRTFNLSSGGAVCNIGVTYADGEPIVTCPFTYKFVRTYTVIDWCDPSDVRTFTQVVKVGDTTAPTFTGPTQDRDFDGVADDDLIYTTNAGNICAAYIRLDAGVSAVDNCSDNVTITASIYPGGDLDATPIGAFDVDPTDNNAEVTSAIPVGCHVLRYTFTDECGNSDFEDFDFCVEDGTAPVAICEDGLNISISSGSATGGASTGIAILTPGMIDGGSYDDCSGVTLSIACVNGDNINTEPYDQELVLTCADLGIKRVGLRVEDAEGNVNYCWLDVLVEDKNAPSCIAPGPVNISCIVAKATLPADIMEATEAELDATFGFATGVDNCEVTITSTITGKVNSCGVGSFNRVFTATDGEGFTNTNNCRQRITVYGVHDYRLTFPTDEEGGCADIPSYDGIAAQEDACDLITTDVTVDTLRTLLAGEECFKLRVTYDVVNWCEYGTLGQPYLIPRDGDGIRNPETQALYLNVDPGTDQTTTSDDFAFLSRFSDRNYNPGAPQNDQLLDDGDDMDGTDDDNGNDNIDDDAYAADASRGHFRYIQYIKIYDEVAPVITSDAPADCFAGTSATCTAEVELTFTATDECSAASVQVELDADYNAATGFVRTTGVNATNDGAGNFTINLSDIPVGNHAIRVRASDGCGNFDVEIIEFCVTGDKAPTPICIQTLTVTLMPDGNGGGMAAIWASDFIASDVEDCFGNVIDKYSIYTEEEAGVAGFAPVAGRLGIDLTCDDFGNDVPVRVYAIDNNGSADYCSVVVEVQAFQDGLCEGSGGNLAGAIATQDDDMLEGVEVSLTGENDMDEMVVTAANGAYTFTNLPLGVDYTIQPDYNVGVDLAEIKVSDVVKIGSVILGTSSFDTGYDFIAGDVDMDGSLSIFDMVAIQRVILGLDETFATGETWRFVTEEYNLTTSNWASSFPEVYNANDLAGVQSGVDFVAVQMGNVIREAGRSALNLETEDASLEAGQTHTMILTAATMSGFQGTIELAAGLELIDVTYEGEGGLNLNAAAEGMIGIVLREATSLTLEVRATEAGQLSELVSLTDALVLTEGVDLNGASTGLGLAFNGSSIAPAYSALLQNTPNPVVESTTIRFELAVAGTATLSVQDIAGRVVLVRQLDAVAGMNRVDLTTADLGAAGVLTYTLTSGDFVATKKMVVVR